MEKQIEEIAKDMCEYYYEGTCYQDKKPCDCKCDIFSDAQYLYAKGYRKASEVAREIINEIADLMWQGESEKLNYIIGGRYYSKQEFIAEIKKKYESEGDNGNDNK